MENSKYKLFYGIVKQLSNAPDSQLSIRLREDCRNFIKSDRSEKELYDFLDSLSQQSLSEASRFVKSLCDVERFYKKSNTS